jgi:hypothetical protein
MCASAATRSAHRFLLQCAQAALDRREEQALADIAWELIEFLDLADVAHRRVADLPFGCRSASSLRARSRRGRSCCCSTSRPAASITPKSTGSAS